MALDLWYVILNSKSLRSSGDHLEHPTVSRFSKSFGFCFWFLISKLELIIPVVRGVSLNMLRESFLPIKFDSLGYILISQI